MLKFSKGCSTLQSTQIFSAPVGTPLKYFTILPEEFRFGLSASFAKVKNCNLFVGPAVFNLSPISFNVAPVQRTSSIIRILEYCNVLYLGSILKDPLILSSLCSGK